MTELSTRFNFRDIEDKWCRYWEDHHLFHAQANPKKKPYGIVIPPPNVTGILHMGHALNNTLQDILIRYKRMNGWETLWMPGTDHAGIATQNVVEKELAKEGKKRQDLGREAFLKRLWDWKKQYGDTIIHQLKKLGASCDWQRTCFTMDEHYSQAVKLVFIRLYQKGLIYRGKYIINWCPRCHTALSDEEAEHHPVEGKLYYIRYPFKDNDKDSVVVATTRPETMLGDTAVAVHPKDRRYKKLIGKTLLLPFLNREIRLIADSFVDPKFGTGAVKVTPAHDPNDFLMGKRHDLASINIMHPDATLNHEAGEFEGMDRFEAREAIGDALQELNLLEKVEPHSHAVGHCYRCHTVVEPYLSQQWFVKMKPLAKPAMDVVKKGKIKFYPPRWTKVYLNWMENIRDWCISRQIWWGHRVPVWYCLGDGKCRLQCREPIVAETPPEKCPHCGSSNLKQDEDVLDTWFSSWLWPFATLHWPQKDKDLEYFYPTSSLFTAPEIIFFWVARMIMAGLEFMGDIPFADVYIHGTVRDTKGRKMSKSLGNAINPLEIIQEYGADALRFSLIINSGQDIFISKEKFEIGRNFANKIWNAARLILMNTADADTSCELVHMAQNKAIGLPSRWIISQFYATLHKVNKAIETYRFSEGETLIYDFFWGNFCDWYLEIIKERWSQGLTRNIARRVLEDSLKMIHPFMPFVSEEIWEKCQKIPKALCLQAWPEFHRQGIDREAQKNMQMIIAMITSLRNLRAAWNIKPMQAISCHLTSSVESELNLLKTNAGLITLLAKVGQLTIDQQPLRQKKVATAIVGHTRCVIPLEEVIDFEKERQRILSQIKEQQGVSKGLAQRLQNKEFLKKAPAEVVEKDKERLAVLQSKIQELRHVIASLES